MWFSVTMFPDFDGKHGTFVTILNTRETCRSAMYKKTLMALNIESKRQGCSIPIFKK